MLIQKGSREDAIHSLINVWLKDPRKSCAWCGSELMTQSYCCEKPLYLTNADTLRQFLKEMQERRDEQKNKFASTDDKTLRLAISMPPGLMQFLEAALDSMYHEKLFTKEFGVTWFAKHFKQFAIPREV